MLFSNRDEMMGSELVTHRTTHVMTE